MKPNHSQLRNRAIDCGFFLFVMYSSETGYDVGKFHKFP